MCGSKAAAAADFLFLKQMQAGFVRCKVPLRNTLKISLSLLHVRQLASAVSPCITRHCPTWRRWSVYMVLAGGVLVYLGYLRFYKGIRLGDLLYVTRASLN